MPPRTSVCHILSIMLETQALSLHLLAGDILLKSFIGNFFQVVISKHTERFVSFFKRLPLYFSAILFVFWIIIRYLF